MTAQSQHIFRINPNRTRYLERVLWLAALAPLVMLGSFAYHYELFGRDYELLGKLLANPVFVVLLLMMPLTMVGGLWVSRVFSKTARLFVDGQGLRLQSGLGSLLGSMASVECPWNEVLKVSVIDSMGIVQIRRYPRLDAKSVLALRPADWMEDLPGANPVMSKSAPSAMRETALWKVLDEAGLFAERYATGGKQAVDFDLTKHPATKLALIVILGLLAYGMIDSLMRREAWADWGMKYIMPHVLVGVLVMLVGFLSLKWSHTPEPVPLGVVIPLAVLLGFSAATANWSLLIRINQYFGGQIMEREYLRNEACDTLVPVELGLPAIEYTQMAKDYWCQFPIDQRHRVPVREGLAGLYQVDLSQYTDAIREFRQTHARQNGSGFK